MNRFLALLAVAAILHESTLVDGGQVQGVAAIQGEPPQRAKSGVSINDPKAFQGYTLVSPMTSAKSFLIDMQGNIVRTWEGTGTPALTAYLLPNGNLLRPCSGGAGFGSNRGGLFPKGRIQGFTWDGELVWDFAFQSNKEVGKFTYTHDLVALPNGNVLAIMTVGNSAAEAAAMGRKAGGPLMLESLLELKRKGKNGAEVVWEWHVRDHLIQDHDAAKPNHGTVADHPERIDINFGDQSFRQSGFGGMVPQGDWTHFNSLSYNADLDQVMISVHGFSEFWIIDHGTTTAEAAGRKGGRYGRGGELLYRWGNPQAYRAGKAEDQRLFHQHNAHWIPKGHPGAGHVLVFNNGLGRKGGNYSSVDEIVLPVDAEGRYPLKAGSAFGPDKAVWVYTTPKKSDFYAAIISGAQRLPNGNTLICSGTSGTVFEVTPNKEKVWTFAAAALPGGLNGFGGGGADQKKSVGQKGDAKKGGEQPSGMRGGLGGFSLSMLFRATRFGPDDPPLAGRKLAPAPQEKN
jgi:hypothetical protein